MAECHAVMGGNTVDGPKHPLRMHRHLMNMKVSIGPLQMSPFVAERKTLTSKRTIMTHNKLGFLYATF